MKKDTSFGAGPEQLRRLFALGTEESDEQEQAAQIGSWDLMKEKPGSRIGRYKLLSILGEGGMGIVYLAEQEHPVKRQVALKVIKPGMDSQRIVARFEAERQTLALLDHPNIAHVLDAGTTEAGRPYFVMEYVDGLPITEHCDQNKLSIDERLALFSRVCDAIQHAHEKGVIHRDIKPSNILVAVQRDKAIPKVIDFGVARAMSPQPAERALMTEEGQIVGTPEYMSPEQVSLGSEGIDIRSDIYSLGVLLYVLLTGALPFDSETLRKGGLDTVRRVITEEDPKTPSRRLAALGEQGESSAKNRDTEIRALTKRLHRELEWIPLKAMAKDRERRYRSAAELADDIQNYLNGTPLIAGPPSRLYRVRKFVKRNRTMVSVLGVAAVAVGIGVSVSSVLYVRAQVEAERSRSVSGLLNNTVFSALSPYRGQGEEVTVVSVLNAVSGTLEGRFRDAPLIEAEVRHALGVAYSRQDSYGSAVQHLERAFDIRRRELGHDDLLTIDSMYRLGVACYYQGRYAEAEPLLVEAVSRRKRLLDEADDTTLHAKTVLGWTCEAREQYDRARQLYEDVLKTTQRAGIDTHPRAIMALYSIGWWNIAQNRWDEADRYLRRAAELSRQSGAQDAPFPAELTASNGLVCLLQGRYIEAEPLLMESLDRTTRVYGTSHWLTLQSLSRLIYLYHVWGKPDEARKWGAKREATNLKDLGGASGSIRHDPANDTYTIRASGFDIWDLCDEFLFAHKTLRGDGSITARIDSLESVHTWTKVGVMIRRGMEPTSAHASIFLSPYGGIVAFQRRATEPGITSSRNDARPVGFPHWVRLTRRGNAFTAEHSNDGGVWEAVHSGDPNRAGPVEVPMPETVHIGLAIASHDVRRTAEARISHVTTTGDVSPAGPFGASDDINLEALLLPASKGALKATPVANDAQAVTYPGAQPAQSLDGELTTRQITTLVLRHGGSAGSIKYEEATETYTLVGAGKDIWSTADELHFAYKKLTGDGAIAARIDTVQPVNPWTKAGVMMRNALTADSEHASVFITPVNRVCFQYRAAVGQNALSIHTDPNAVTLPHWVRLVRAGNTYKAQHSHDGLKWKDLEGSDSIETATTTWTAAAEIHMKESVHIGLVVSSHAGPLSAEAKMSHVTVTGKVEPAGEFLWSEDVGFQMIMLPKK